VQSLQRELRHGPVDVELTGESGLGFAAFLRPAITAIKRQGHHVHTASCTRTGEMTCQEFIRRLGDYVDDDLPADAWFECGRHLASCRECTEYLRSYQLAIRIAQTCCQDHTDRPRTTSCL
jgi:hypothetical protein